MVGLSMKRFSGEAIVSRTFEEILKSMRYESSAFDGIALDMMNDKPVDIDAFLKSIEVSDSSEGEDGVGSDERTGNAGS